MREDAAEDRVSPSVLLSRRTPLELPFGNSFLNATAHLGQASNLLPCIVINAVTQASNQYFGFPSNRQRAFHRTVTQRGETNIHLPTINAAMQEPFLVTKYLPPCVIFQLALVHNANIIPHYTVCVVHLSCLRALLHHPCFLYTTAACYLAVLSESIQESYTFPLPTAKRALADSAVAGRS